MAVILAAVVAVTALPETIRVHWTVGDMPYNGARTAAHGGGPRVPPVVGAFVPVFGRAALDQPDVAPELNGLRRLADPVLLATLGLLAARQLLLIALNR